MKKQNRITTKNWDLFDTRHVVYQTKNLSPRELEGGYHWAYNEFYSWANIIRGSLQHDSIKHKLKHFLYTGGWKKFEVAWNFLIKTNALNQMLPVLEAILSKVKTGKENYKKESIAPSKIVASVMEGTHLDDKSTLAI